MEMRDFANAPLVDSMLPMQGTLVWTNSRRWWRTGKPGMLQSMGSQRVRHNWASKQQQRELQISEWPGLDYLLILESKVESIPSKLLAWEIEKCTCLKRLLYVVFFYLFVFSKKREKAFWEGENNTWLSLKFLQSPIQSTIKKKKILHERTRNLGISVSGNKELPIVLKSYQIKVKFLLYRLPQFTFSCLLIL